KEQKKGLAHKLLTGKIRLANFKGKWQNKSLADYFEKIYDKNNENNTNILTMSAQSGLIRQEHFFSKQVASENLSRYFLLKKGDYAYNKSYSAGYPLGAIKRLDNFEKGILSPLYICFRIKEQRISNDYCKHYFDSGLLNKEIQKIAQEGARNHGLLNVSSEEFFQMCIHVPAEIKEQEAIAKILTTANLEIELLEKELEMIKEQKKALMELLLTGIVRVK
ncbi:MAG: restriction endonuclease subunit S, partial [Bacteroidales bacterium]|nr:restriction endonuclease subunit S [Bacteroidales bacterium]